MKDSNFPLWLVIIMNLNVMIGAGIFVNIVPLTELAGSFGFLSYFAVACVILPLVLVVAQFGKLYSDTEGGLYVYSKEGLGKNAAIVSSLSYFLAKTVSSCILINTIVVYLYSIIPALESIPVSHFRFFVLVFLIWLNLLGLRFGSKVQLGFVIIKIMPIVLVVISGFFIFNFKYFSLGDFSLSNFSASLPIALYALIGFETCCAIGHAVKSPEKNMSRAVISSFFVVAIIYMSFQGMLFGGVGKGLLMAKTPMGLFFVRLFGNSPFLQYYISKILSLFVMFSIIGACYGMIFSNSWNAYIITKDADVKFFNKLNSHGIPIYSVLLQFLLIFFFLSMNMNIIAMTFITVFGVVISYILSTVSLLKLYKDKKDQITLFDSTGLAIQDIAVADYIYKKDN